MEAIVEVATVQAVEQLAERACASHDVTVRLSESAFDGEGRAFLFGHVLAHLFAHEASLSSFVRTTVQLVTTGRQFRFPVLERRARSDVTGTFRDLYAAELEYLYSGLAAELGREQTRIAPMLGRDADVGMSRLAQTVAFLSARVRQRLEDDLPDFIHPLVESLRPWLLRPLPSATIVELTPDPAMKEPQSVGAGSVFTSRPVDGSPCIFRSTTAIQVRPWSLDAVEIASERTRGSGLRLSLLVDAATGESPPAQLRLFFALPVAAALELRTKILSLRDRLGRRGRAAGGKTEVMLSPRPRSRSPRVSPPRALVPEHADPFFALRRLL